MLLLMNSIAIEGKSFKAAVQAELTNPAFVQEMQRGAYEGISNKLASLMGEYRDMAIDSPAFQQTHPDAYRQIQRNRMLAERRYQKTPREAMAE